MTDDLDNYIKQIAQPSTARDKMFKARDIVREKTGVDIPDDVVDDFYNVTGLESGRSHYNKDGSVKMSPPDPKDGQRAVGWSQIKPGTIKQYGLDPMDEMQNIAGGLRYFYDADPTDPVSRRIGYFSGIGSKSQQRYKKTGEIPQGGDFTGTSFDKYISGTGGYSAVDAYIKNGGIQQPAAPSIDEYIKGIDKQTQPGSALPPVNPTGAYIPPPATADKTFLRPGEPLAPDTATEPPPTDAEQNAQNALTGVRDLTAISDAAKQGLRYQVQPPVAPATATVPPTVPHRPVTPQKASGHVTVSVGQITPQPPAHPLTDYVKREPTEWKSGKPGDPLNSDVSFIVDLPERGDKGAFATQAARQKLQQEFGLTPEQAAQFADVSGIKFDKGDSQVRVRVSRKALAGAIGADAVRADYENERHNAAFAGYQQQEANPDVSQVATANPFVRPTGDPLRDQAMANVVADPFSTGTDEAVQKEYERLQRTTPGEDEKKALDTVGQWLSKVDVPGTSTGLVEGAGWLSDILSGATKLSPIGLLEYARGGASPTGDMLSRAANDARLIAQSSKDHDTFVFEVGGQQVRPRAVGEALGSAAVQVPTYVGLSTLPGGAVMAFAATEGLGSLGRGDNALDVAGHAIKGGALGAVFSAAPRIGKLVEDQVIRTAVNPVFEAGKEAGKGVILASKILGTTAELGTIGGGTFAVEKASGASNEDAFKSAIVNTLFGLTKHVPLDKLIGKTYRMHQGDNVDDVTIDPDGSVKLLPKGKVPPGGVDAEIDLNGVIDMKQDASGVYRASGDTAAAPRRAGEPIADLNEAPPRRIETPLPEALQRLPLDTRAQKIGVALEDGQPKTLAEIAKATRYNPAKVNDAIETLYAAGKVEILPDSRIRLIEPLDKGSTSLYEQFNEKGRVSQPPAQMGQTPSVPQTKVSPSQEQITGKPDSTVSPSGIAPTEATAAEAAGQNASQNNEVAPSPYAGKTITHPVSKERLTFTGQLNERGNLIALNNFGRERTVAPRDADKWLAQGESGTPEVEKGLSRNFRAGTNDATLTFASRDQRDLYDYYANEKKALQGGGQRANQTRVKDLSGLKTDLAQRLGVPETEIFDLARRVSEDVKTQMKGVQHGEERNVVDNVIKPQQPAPAEPTKHTDSRAPKPTEGRLSLSQYIRRAGGIRPTDSDSGEARRLSNKETGSSGLINRNAPKTAAQMAEDVYEAGYLHDVWGGFEDVNGNELMNHVEDDLTGVRKHYPQGSEQILSPEDQEALSWEKEEGGGALRRRLDALSEEGFNDLAALSSLVSENDDAKIILQKAENYGITRDEENKFYRRAKSYGVPRDIAEAALAQAGKLREARALEGQASEPDAEGSGQDAVDSGADTSAARFDPAEFERTPDKPEQGYSADDSLRRTVEDLTPSERSALRRSLAPKEHQGKAELHGLLAEHYNLSPDELAKLEPLGEVGKFGQTSHVLKAALASPENYETFNQFRSVFTPEIEPYTEDDLPFRDATADVASILDTIANDAGFSRSSQMGADAWSTFLDRYAERLGDDAVSTILSAVDHQAAWHRNIIRLRDDPRLETVYSKIHELGERFGWEPLANAHWGAVKPEGFDPNAPAFDLKGEKVLVKMIRSVGKDYGRESVGDVGPLSEQTIKETLVNAVRRTAQEELSARTGARPQSAQNRQGTRPSSQAEADRGSGNKEELEPFFARADFGQTETPEFRNWFKNSKVVDENGKPLVVYSGHSNLEMYGDRYSPQKGVAGGFYASEDPAITSNYATGKFGDYTEYSEGSQYRFKQKNGKYGKKIWQIELTPEQQQIARDFIRSDEGGNYDVEEYWRNNRDYDKDARRAVARGGLRDLQSIFTFLDSMGENIWYRDHQDPRPNFEKQQYSTFEKLLNKLGIEWQSFEREQPGNLPIYLSIQNPLDASKPFPQDLLAALKRKAAKVRDPYSADNTQWTKDYPMRQWVEDIENGDEYWSTHIPAKGIDIIKSFGYDGIKEIGNKTETDGAKRQINWIAFDPGQIKSAIGNRGTFDPNDPSILAARLTIPGEVDLWGQPTSPHSTQNSLFDLGTPEKVDIDTELKKAFGKKTGGYISSLIDSPDRELSKAAQTIADARILAKDYKAEDVINDAADALDAFSYARNLKTSSGNILAQQGFDGKTFSDRLSGRAKNLLTAMESGNFEKALGLEIVQPKGALFMTAWHGSPHRFDKFDIAKIGTGEGAQAYGHGLYFTDKEAIAEHYKDSLSKESYRTVHDGEPWSPDTLEHLGLRVRARNNGVDLDATIDTAKDKLKRANDQTRPMLERDLAKLENLRDTGGVVQHSGAKYKVNLKPSEDEYLHWDKPLTEQSVKVQQALGVVPVEKLPTDWFMRIRDGETVVENGSGYTIATGRSFQEARDNAIKWLNRKTGKMLYTEIASRRGSQRAASDYLKSLGIRGIKYLDGTSRNNGEGSHNYVLFDDNDVEIQEVHFNRASLTKESKALGKEMHALNTGGKSLTQILADGRWELNPRNIIDFKNPEAISVAMAVNHRVTGQMTGFTGMTMPTAYAPRFRDELMNVRDLMKQRGETAVVKTLDHNIAVFDAARLLSEGGIVTASVNIPKYPNLSKYSTQEELAHRADMVTEESPELEPYKGEAGFDDAIRTLVRQGYPPHTWAREFTGKLQRDDAAEALGITEEQVENFRQVRDDYLFDLGVTGKQYLDRYATISESNQRRAENYVARQPEQSAAGNARPRIEPSQPERSPYDGVMPRSGREVRQRGYAESAPLATRTESRPELAGLRQGEVSGGTLAKLNRTALATADARYIDKHSKGDTALAKAAKDELLFARLADEPKTKISDYVIDIANVPKAIKASVDLSAAGRQGWITALAHPKIAAKAFAKQLKSAASAEYHDNFVRDLNLHPAIELAEDSGLYLTSLAGQALADREEAFMTRVLGENRFFKNNKFEAARKLASYPVRASERAYTTFLDDLRINSFASLAKKLHEANIRSGREDSMAQYEGLARFINYSTGRGDLGKANDLAPYLNAAFFSARYWASRLQVMNPKFYATLPPGARGLVIKDLMTSLAAMAIIGGLLKLAGAKIEYDDPNDPNTLKIGFGDYTYDISAGLLKHLRYAARMVMATQNKRPTDQMEYLTSRYIRSSLAPVPAAVVNAASGKDYIGQPTTWSKEAKSLVVPIMVDNFRDAANADGLPGILKMSPEFFGISTTRKKPLKR